MRRSSWGRSSESSSAGPLLRGVSSGALRVSGILPRGAFEHRGVGVEPGGASFFRTSPAQSAHGQCRQCGWNEFSVAPTDSTSRISQGEAGAFLLPQAADSRTGYRFCSRGVDAKRFYNQWLHRLKVRQVAVHHCSKKTFRAFPFLFCLHQDLSAFIGTFPGSSALSGFPGSPASKKDLRLFLPSSGPFRAFIPGSSGTRAETKKNGLDHRHLVVCVRA